MKNLFPFGFLLFFLTSCQTDWEFTPNESKFFLAYKPGDSLFFLSSEGERDTFGVVSIDSVIRTGLGFFNNQVQNDKNLFIRKLPIIPVQGSTMDSSLLDRLTRRQFLGAHKRPKENKLNYCIRFKEFISCSETFGIFVESVNLSGTPLKNCYTWKNQFVGFDSSGLSIDSIFWTLKSGMVAWKQFDGTVWRRTNIY